VIPEDWEVQKIRDLCKLVNGRGFKPYEWGTRGYPIIRIQNLNGSDEFNFYEGPFNPKILVESGQLLFAWSGSRGTSFGPHVWYGETAVLNYHTWKIEVDETAVDPDFYLYALKNLTVSIEDQAHGASALVHTQKWEMEGFDLAIPSEINEQRAVAAALSDVDAALAGLLRLIAKKKDLKQATMQTLLTGQTRLPGFSGEWQVKRLGELVDTDPENLGSGTVPDQSFNYIALENVDRGRLLGWTEQQFATAPSRARRVLRSGDVLIATVRPNLQAHLLFGEAAGLMPWVCSTGFCVVRCIPGKSWAPFIFAQFFAGGISKQIETLIAGSNYPAINSGDVRALEVAAPCYKEQTAIATVLSDMDAEIAALTAQADKTRLLKQAMMQELLTGRTRLPLPVDHGPEGAHV